MENPKHPSKFWRILRAIGFVIFCLATLVFLAIAIENWRGKRAWEQFRLAGEAQGEKFDLAAFIHQPVPPDQNFAQTPFLAPLLDYEFVGGEVRWRDSSAVERIMSVSIYGGQTAKAPRMGSWQKGEFTDLQAWQAFYRNNTNFPSRSQPQGAALDVLFALEKYAPVLTELRAASQRPYAFFPLRYKETFFGLLEVKHLGVLKGLTEVVELRALAELEAGQTEVALADTKLAFSFAQLPESEPTLIAHLVQIAFVNITLRPVWEGLAQHRWTEAQLVEVQKTLTATHLLADYGQAMRGERAFNNEMMAQDRTGRRFPGGGPSYSEYMPFSLMPRGWLYQNQLVINRMYQQLTFPAVDAAAHRIYPEKCQESAFKAMLGRRTPYNLMAWMLFPAIAKSAEKFAHVQTEIDEATVACALERHRLASGKYPETLAALAPKFIDKLPNDVMNGQPLHYRLEAAGQPLIYSVGWNQTDDGGTVAMGKGTSPQIDSTRGDWVWRYPAP